MTDASDGGRIQSLDSALQLLAALSEFSGPVSLSELARSCDMPVSKAHRYLASFVHAGLVQQGGRSGKYDLSRGAVRLGLAAMARSDMVNRTADALSDLCEQTGLTALLSVWGTSGPTVVRWEKSTDFIVTTLGLGTTMPLLSSATGLAFLAYAPSAVTGKLLEREQPRWNGIDVDTLSENVRAAGFASVAGNFIPGLADIAAPVLDWQKEAQAVVTLISADPQISQPSGHPVRALTAFCRARSVTAEIPTQTI
jgi:DNA-binding IclR family transcriptional regulator